MPSKVVILELSRQLSIRSFFFFNDTATTEIYTLSLHDALPISRNVLRKRFRSVSRDSTIASFLPASSREESRSEEHTSELQSRLHLVCRLLLEKKKIAKRYTYTHPARSHCH